MGCNERDMESAHEEAGDEQQVAAIATRPAQHVHDRHLDRLGLCLAIGPGHQQRSGGHYQEDQRGPAEGATPSGGSSQRLHPRNDGKHAKGPCSRVESKGRRSPLGGNDPSHGTENDDVGHAGERKPHHRAER